ncbi:5'/3'-nucleotidase SurE [Synechococcus sp. PCC 7335]|uniref:5'/3'-nucleotidase SurE n=1 Tax=Synechococcus sp. (strain ATCC 29403 / PCC 7335) TaxID=91464 RepID=UPI00017ED90B|nr:5'/3'-nucleotidase SurE [Synechococcus sp. PCC 7335]EDX87751.1 5'/3'-nucleotidase SurE [Synechococcus sp. PCC 7335]
MKILVSNDDGVFALGIRTLANKLAKAGHQVTVVCPDRERSATGHGLTLHEPLRVEQAEGVFDPEVTAWACSGTPSDCVKLALDALLLEKPDFLVSGINHGANLGTDVLYSGTVSAAMEGVLEGVSAIAISLLSGYPNFQPAANFAVHLITALETQPLSLPVLLNVNIPPVEVAKIQPPVITHQGVRRYFDQFEKRVDPRGRIYYWLAGEIMEEEDAEIPMPVEQAFSSPSHTVLSRALIEVGQRFMTDVQAIKKNHITITPLQGNLTAYTALPSIDAWKQQSLKEVPGTAKY